MSCNWSAAPSEESRQTGRGRPAGRSRGRGPAGRAAGSTPGAASRGGPGGPRPLARGRGRQRHARRRLGLPAAQPDLPRGYRAGLRHPHAARPRMGRQGGEHGTPAGSGKTAPQRAFGACRPHRNRGAFWCVFGVRPYHMPAIWIRFRPTSRDDRRRNEKASGLVALSRSPTVSGGDGRIRTAV